uniref:Uncharacterized protein n=1 Tax=Rhizophora mucronata TaxID=61149 RepID=A0A2P2QZM2_RHIMU
MLLILTDCGGLTVNGWYYVWNHVSGLDHRTWLFSLFLWSV